jgi:hypothetical protein
MEIGKPTREYTVEPVECPVPPDVTVPDPERKTDDPEPARSPSG